MKNSAKIILIILTLFVAMCHEGDRVKENHLNPEFASTYLGGNRNEFCEAIAVDDAGYIYVAGNTRSLDFPTTEGAYNRDPKGKSDVFIAKFDNDLETLLASTLIGGDEDECAYTMLFDPRGYVYVAGYTSSKNFPTTAHAYDKNYNGGDGDTYILKMDKDLKTLVSSTYLGGSGVEDDWRSPELVQDGDGNIYIAGITDSDDFPTTPGAFQEKYKGGTRDVFLSKFDSDLRELLASTLLGGSNDDRMGRSLCIDVKKNEICVGGYTFSPDFPTSQDAYGREISGQLDGFVSKLSMDLKVLTASTILNSGWIYCMMIHENGDIYVGGHAGKRLPTTSNAFHQVFDKASDQGFISCLSNDLSKLKSSTVIPGSYAIGGGEICSLNLCQSADGHVLSAGWVRPIDFPITPGVYDETQNGKGDTYIMKMDRDLSKVLLSTFIGGSRSERWNRMTTDGTGKIYLASYTLSSDFPTTNEAAFKKFSDVINDKEENLGTSPRDAFIIKIDENLSAEVFEEFHEAAKRNQVNKLQKLLSTNDMWLEKRDKYQRTPLHSAAHYGAFLAARFLLDRGADFNVKEESGNTPLHLASIFRHDEIIDLLIQHEVDVNMLNAQGQSPLYLASLFGNPESIKLLLANGANSNIRDADGNTPLHIAVLYRHPENLDEILKVNPEIDAINTEGYTSLYLAVRRPDNEKAIGHLLQQGADMNIHDTTGRNALLVSVGSNQKEYIRLLVSKGIDINSQDDNGNTALHYPLSNVLRDKRYLPYSTEIVKILIEEGADPQIKNKEGKSPMDTAVESGENELINLLKSYSSNNDGYQEHETQENIQNSKLFKCDYLGQELPGDIPVKFAPGIVSTNDDDSCFEISVSGNEMVFSREMKIYTIKQDQYGVWSSPTPLSFSGGESSLSKDGKKIYFNSRDHFPGAKVPLNVWVIPNLNDRWDKPFPLGEPVINQTVHAPTVAGNGNIYASGIIRLKFIDGEYQPPEQLMPAINGYHPFISADESFMIFDKRPMIEGNRSDLFITFRNSNDTWTEPVRLGEEINTSALETNAFVTTDGKYMFFTRKFDVYWVKADFIGKIKTQVLK